MKIYNAAKPHASETLAVNTNKGDTDHQTYKIKIRVSAYLRLQKILAANANVAK
jgi:hypothetical protein